VTVGLSPACCVPEMIPHANMATTRDVWRQRLALRTLRRVAWSDIGSLKEALLCVVCSWHREQILYDFNLSKSFA